MTSAQSVLSILETMGAEYTLRKVVAVPGVNAWTAGVPTTTYNKQRGHQRFYKPREIVGTIMAHDVLVTLAPSAIIPAIGDAVAIGAFTAGTAPAAKWMLIVSAAPAHRAGKVAAWKIQARG